MCIRDRFEETKEVLAKYGHELTAVEEAEMEPSLGNGGLGRLAACFLDSIATLGLPGDGVGLNYHEGLFLQKFSDHKQWEDKNPWLSKDSWLTRTDCHFQVPFKDFTLTSTMYDIDVPGYQQEGKNKLHLFDLDTVDAVSYTHLDVYKRQNLERLKGKENITQSGQRIDICANIGTREDIENVIRSDAGGIGLFRSEFLYMENGPKLRCV